MVLSRIRSPVISGFRGARRRRHGLKAVLVCSLLGFALGLGAPPAPAGELRQEIPLPEPGPALERTLEGGALHPYRIPLTAGQYLRLVIEQKGIDVVVECLGPDGATIAEVDSPNGRYGPETLSLVAGVSGTYRLVVRSLSQDAPSGIYELRYDPLRPASAEDRRRVAAERTQADAFRWRAERTEESLRRALQAYRQALASWRELANRTREAEVLHQLGTTHRLLGDNPEALELFGQSLAIRRELGNRRGEAEALNQIGLAHWSLSQNGPAAEALSGALAVWRALEEPQQQARVLNNLGLLHHASGRLDDALAAFTQALDLFHRAGDRRREAIARNNAGKILEIRGQPLAAGEHYRQAVALARAAGDRRCEADALNNLGILFADFGEAQEALERYAAALAIFRDLGDRRRQAAALSNLGNLYLRLREPQRARELLGEALTLHKEVGDRRGEARSLNNLGHAYALAEQGQIALAMYRKSLAIQRQLEDRRGEATTLNGLGRVLTSLGQPGEALAPLGRALELHRELDDHVGLAASHHELGLAYAGLADGKAALEHFGRALRLSRAVGVRAREAMALRELARIEMIRGRLDQARAYAEPGLELVESLRAEIAAEELRTSCFTFLRESYELYVELMMRMHAQDPTAGFAAAAFLAAERARARSLLDLLREARVELRRDVDPELLEQERQLRWRLNAQAHRQRRAASGVAGAAAQQELDRLVAEYQQLRAEIRARSPRYAALTEVRPVSLSAIRRHYGDEDTLLLEYALGEERSFLWLVTATTLTSFELPSREKIETAAREVYGRVSVLDPRAEERQRQALATLSRMLLEPVAPRLAGQRLAIVADGALRYVPFAALPAPRIPGPGAPSSPAPLVAEHEIVLLPSAAVLGELRRPRPDRPAATATLAIMADPVFDAGDVRVQRGETAAAPIPAQTGLRRDDLRRLPWTRREAEAIAAVVGPQVPAGAVLVALDFEAGRERATDPALGGYRILHFATHGQLNSTHPELSGLVLSLVDQEGRPRDGYLRLHDVYNLRLGAELVVLSGCRTALGREIRGEGLEGLTRGFFHAGVPRVVASLWAVEDRATAELMARFYRALFAERRSPAAALRAAQLSMWRDRDFRNPYYWGAFVLQGDWRSGER